MRKTIIGRILLPFAFCFVTAVFFTGCALRPSIIPTSEYDTPEKACREGMKLLDDGKSAEALSRFKRSVGLDPKYQPGYIGLALAYTEGGLYKNAEKKIKKAKKLNKKNPAVYVAWGR
ncbi:MAG: tetratricopeptide repeat protein, partial [Elusimicrobia bacterium]|nr:tetratricopeptide repeat protein [Elusimicrobiota bacterium]